MTSAVLLAGYNNRRAVEKYGRVVAESYGETYVETGYKPLREFSLHHHGRHVTKPLIQFTLEELLKDDLIGDVVIVGHKALLEEKLLPLLKEQTKPWKIIGQNDPIDPEVLSRFHIVPGSVPHDSVAGNLIKGYAVSRACKEEKAALIAACDSPMTSLNFINSFISGARRMREEADLIITAVPIGVRHDKLGRRPLLLLNDTGVELNCRKDRHGRCGFRLSSLLYCNLYRIDVSGINVVYSLRKALSPKVQLQIFRICRELGYPGIFSKYFRKKDLSVRECENIFSRLLSGRVRALPIEGEETTYDYDGTAKELKLITRMLKRKV